MKRIRQRRQFCAERIACRRLVEDRGESRQVFQVLTPWNCYESLLVGHTSPHEIPKDLVATLVTHGAEGHGKIVYSLSISHTDDMLRRRDESVFRPGFDGVGEKLPLIGDHSQSGGHRAAHDNRVVRPEMAKHGFRQFRGESHDSIHKHIARPTGSYERAKAALDLVVRPIPEAVRGVSSHGLLRMVEVVEDNREPFAVRKPEDAGEEITQDRNRDLRGRRNCRRRRVLNLHRGPGGAEERLVATRPKLIRLTRVTDLVNAGRLKSVLQMERQTAEMFHRPSGYADGAAAKSPRHSN